MQWCAVVMQLKKRQQRGQEERTRLESEVPASYDNHLCNAC